MSERKTQLADGSVLTVSPVDGGLMEETRRDNGDGYVTVTTKHPDGAITETRMLASRLSSAT